LLVIVFARILRDAVGWTGWQVTIFVLWASVAYFLPL